MPLSLVSHALHLSGTAGVEPFSTHRAGLAVLGSVSSTSISFYVKHACWENHHLPRRLSGKKLQGSSEVIFPGDVVPELTQANRPSVF